MTSPAVSRALPLRIGRSTVVALGAYVAALAGTEAVTAFVSPVAGAGAAGALLLVLLTHYVLAAEADTRAFAALALVPLLRLSSLALATGNRVELLAISGVPVLLAVVLAARALELPGVLALWEIRLRSQWHVAVGALVVGMIAAPALDSAPVLHRHSLAALAAAAVVVFVFAGVLEELVFRGLIQGALEPLIGGWSVAVADLVFTAAYLDSGSAAYIVFMAAFGLACGWWVRRTRSLAGAAAAHGALAVSLLVLSTVLP